MSQLLATPPSAFLHPNEVCNSIATFNGSSLSISPLSREGLTNFARPLLLLETVNKLATVYRSSQTFQRRVSLGKELQLIDIKYKNLKRVEIRAQIDKAVIEDYQIKVSNSIWLLHECDALNIIDLHVSPAQLNEKTVIVFVRSLFVVENSIPRGNDPPIWRSFNDKLPAENAKMITIRALTIFNDNDSNLKKLNDFIQNKKKMQMRYVGKISSLLRTLRMTSIPEIPEECKPMDDPNVSTLFDAMINPSLFNINSPFSEIANLSSNFISLMPICDAG